MNKSILYLGLILGLLSLQAECGKNQPNKIVRNDSVFLSYWCFPENSYWIYKDSINGELDTSIITATNQYLNEGYHDNTEWEFHVISHFNNGLSKTQVGRPSEYDGSQYFYSLDQTWSNGSAIRFFYTKDNSTTDLENHLFQNYLDSIVVNGRSYKDIYCMINIDNQGNDDTVRIEYYARNVGVIKRVYENGRVWELDKYYIAP